MEKRAAYRDEAQFILDQLRQVSPYLSQRLADKIAAYSIS
jgi:hypothetical protein